MPKVITTSTKSKLQIITGATLLLFLSLLVLPTPLITRYILDTIIPCKDLEGLKLALGLVLTILILQKSLGYLQNKIFLMVNSRIIFDLKLKLLNKVEHLPLRTLQQKNYTSGYLLSRINSDTERIRSLFADTIVSGVRDVLTFLVGLSGLFYLHWQMALITITILPFYVLSAGYFTVKIRKKSQEYYEAESQSSKKLEESLSLIPLVKQFSREKKGILNFLGKGATALRTYRGFVELSLRNNLINGFITGLAPLLIIGYGGYEIIGGRLTIGSLIAFNSFTGYLFGPTGRLLTQLEN